MLRMGLPAFLHLLLPPLSFSIARYHPPVPRPLLIAVLITSALACLAMIFLTTCVSQDAHRKAAADSPATAPRDEIVICGQRFHTGTPVVLWTDPDGYDAYRLERRFAPQVSAPASASPETAIVEPAPSLATETLEPSFGYRKPRMSAADASNLANNGWSTELLTKYVDQFVIHYDASGTSRGCFHTLHDVRNLSIHFMLDLDGTIYQTLDLRERAWHATSSNDRSIGIEIANIGAYELGKPDPLARWYSADSPASTRITFPADIGSGGLLVRDFLPRPARNLPVLGEINGKMMRMYDLTPQQYESLIKLTVALTKIFPNITPDYPRTADGSLETRALAPDRLANYQGLLGHFHIQPEKADPGPAFQWDAFLAAVRQRLNPT